jgi:ElaB/YqjD/DUF883 family membrane-anchored ribosome-binding protein
LQISPARGTRHTGEGPKEIPVPEIATDELEDIGADLAENVDEAVGALRQTVDNALDYLKNNPGYALIGAAALGFVVAQLLRRR